MVNNIPTTVNFTFEEVPVQFFAPKITLRRALFDPNAPELGVAEQGGKRMGLPANASASTILHEFGHILGFNDAYMTSPTVASVPCHEQDIMTFNRPNTGVKNYHAQILFETY